MAKDIKAKKASFIKKVLKKAKKGAPMAPKAGSKAEEKAEGEPVGAMTQKYANLAKK